MAEKIKVTPEYLKDKEEEWVRLSEQAQKAFTEAAEGFDKLELYLKGLPAKKLKSRFEGQKEEGLTAFRVLNAHLAKLGSMAAVYEEAERSNRNVTTEN